MTILAIGAAGAVAGLVVPALAERGARVRGLVRKPEQVDQVRGCGAAEVTVGDLRDRTSLDQVFRDIDAVFYIAPAFLPGEAEVERAWSTLRSGQACAGSCFRR